MSKGYRPASSFISNDPEKRQRQLANLAQNRLKRAIKTEAKAPKFNNPAYKTDIIKFAQEQFFIPETRQPIIFENYQKKEILEPLFYVEQRPTMALIGQTKKSGKSTLGAMISSWFLFEGENFSEIYLAARDKDQANWIVFSKLVKAIEMNPQMLIRCKIGKDSIELPHKRSILRCLPTDVSAAGLNPNLVVFDELWSYEYESMTRFFEEMTTVPTRKYPLILIVTYAGYDEDSLLYELYQKGLKNKGKQKDPTYFFYWSYKNLMKWQSKAYLKQQRGRLRKNTYLRLHENRWTSSEEAFIDMDEWDACVSNALVPLLPNQETSIVAAVDIGIKHDSSACVAVARNENKIRLACHKCWIPTPKNPIDLEETVEAYLKDLYKDYRLEKVLYDPYQFHRSATSLAKEGLPMEEFPQTPDRLIQMGQGLYDLIKGGNLELYADREMRSHAQKATAKESARGWRLVKKKASHKIDLIIALAMAVLGATKTESGKVDFWVLGGGESKEQEKETERERELRIMRDDKYWTE